MKQNNGSNQQEFTRTVDNTRGSTLWSFNFIRTRILTDLLNDLMELEKSGVNDSTCDEIQKMLGRIHNLSTEVPKGGLLSGSPLSKNIDRFIRTYVEWNKINGDNNESINERKKLLKKLRKRRQSISNKIRRLQYELNNNLDQKLIDETYNAMSKFINVLPDIFKNLSKSLSDYVKKGGAIT